MLKNKIIVVSGGAGLVGKSFVESILKNDGTAIVADISLQDYEALNKNLDISLKKRIDFYEMDITSSEMIEKTIQAIDSKYGRIDTLINNAYPRNANYGRHFFDVEYADFNENTSLHLGGYFNTCKHFSKYFLSQGFGNIINISSIYGLVAPRFHIYDGTTMTVPVEYAAIKAGVNHLTKYISSYLSGKNIRVNTLTLGGILDGQPESFLKKYAKECYGKGMLNPNDVTGALIFLISDGSNFINGQNIVVDDGFCH